jgi:hypothetical protein
MATVVVVGRFLAPRDWGGQVYGLQVHAAAVAWAATFDHGKGEEHNEMRT